MRKGAKEVQWTLRGERAQRRLLSNFSGKALFNDYNYNLLRTRLKPLMLHVPNGQRRKESPMDFARQQQRAIN
jgi:hypothetical protein